MNFYLVLLHLAGAIALLLWAVRMVRTGVERSQEARLRRLLRENKGGGLRIAALGAGMALVLQSSTAVALLAAGLAGSGVLTVVTGLTLMLGADLGSALASLILSIDLHWIVPVLLLGGSVVFFRGTNRDWRQLGRILIGIALVLISLQMIGTAMAPLRESDHLAAVVTYLGSDLVTSFLVAAAFTWLIHSSVAATLLVATFAAQGLISVELGVALILGVNFGGGWIAVGLTRQSLVEARRIAWGNLLFRGLGAGIALLAFVLLRPPVELLGVGPVQLLLGLHVSFNAALLLAGLPFIGLVARLVERFVTQQPVPEQSTGSSALDETVMGVPALALASATRELLRMAEIIERMLQPLMEIYETGDPEKIRAARRLEDAVDAAQRQIKLYLAGISYSHDDELRRGYELSSFAINLEHVGDAVAKSLLKLAETRRDQKLQFSPAGWRELNELHHRVMVNMRLALNVLVSQDRESARLLLEEKEAMSSAVRESGSQHLGRLRSQASDSMETSDIHLETVRALKTINSLFASVAYPILRDSGDLLDSRLIARSARADGF